MFDAEKIINETPEKSFGPMPAGWYQATLSNFIMKTSKTGQEYLNVEFQTEKGKVWYNLNILHSKEQVRNIAAEQLARLCMAAGFRSIKNPENPEELLGAKVKILVEVDGNYNRVKTVEAIDKKDAAAEQLYSAKPKEPVQESSAEFDDDIPF
mgnify:CR=1 FL=1